MHIPDEISIFGRTYDVRDVCPIQCAEGVLGLAAYRDGVIYLDENMDMALTLVTLWHEAAHIAQQEILGTIDESQARWIALFVHMFLVQNPEILECYRNVLQAVPFGEREEGNR